MMDTRKVLAFILFAEIANVVILAAEKDATSSRSAYFMTRKNIRLTGHVVRRLESPSLLSCSNSCVRNNWCASTNFKTLSKNGKGTCELNKHGAIDGNSNFDDEQGVIFSQLHKVTCTMFLIVETQIDTSDPGDVLRIMYEYHRVCMFQAFHYPSCFTQVEVLACVSTAMNENSFYKLG